ncbi:MAG: TetR/AcrR family transcriptional regulator C-terminal domain-containing protein [Butyrivibrio sp.]|nr:TetR/AcrR family transcriptional regulator C-terminal domain-containing protein [Butyrivibrio sp.]
MNVKNNKRRRESIEKITKVFIELIQTHELSEISVTDICKRADLNRATFYANYLDVYDLADKVLVMLQEEVQNLYSDEIANCYNSNDYLKLLKHIAENQLFYKTCFKLGIGETPLVKYDTEDAEKYFHGEDIMYHMEFFRGGFNRIVKIWLDHGCDKSPEEIAQIISSEYQGRN